MSTVAGHGNHLALALPRLDDADFVVRRYTGVNRDVFHFFVQLFVGHGVQLCSGNSAVVRLHNAKLFGNSRGCHHMVAGDHYRFNARLAADGNCLFGFRTGRVDHTNQPHQG